MQSTRSNVCDALYVVKTSQSHGRRRRTATGGTARKKGGSGPEMAAATDGDGRHLPQKPAAVLRWLSQVRTPKCKHCLGNVQDAQSQCDGC
eukprot:4475886-Pyramimonas_sp.AAC.1